MNNHFTRTHAAPDRQPLQTQFAVNGTCEVTYVHPGIAHLIALSRDSFSPEVRRRLEKAEWEEQLVTRKFAPPQPDFAKITGIPSDFDNVPPHRQAEAKAFFERYTYQFGPLALEVECSSEGHRLPAPRSPKTRAVQVEQGYHGPNGFVKIEPDTPLHVHTARLHLVDGTVIELHDATLTLQPKWISQ